MHTTEPLIPESSHFEVETAIKELKRKKLPRTDQILAKQIQVGGNILCSEIHKLTFFIWNKNCHSSGRNQLLYLFIKRAIKVTVVIIEEYQLQTEVYTIFFSQG
jgi:hypothetical protein